MAGNAAGQEAEGQIAGVGSLLSRLTIWWYPCDPTYPSVKTVLVESSCSTLSEYEMSVGVCISGCTPPGAILALAGMGETGNGNEATGRFAML